MFFRNQKFCEAGHFLPLWPYVTISPPKMCFFGAKHQTPFETIKIPQFWHIGDLFRPFRLAAMTIFPEKGRISEMAIFAFVDFTKFLKIIKLTFFENFKQFLGSSPISICILRGPGWFFTKNLDHPIFPSEIAWTQCAAGVGCCVTDSFNVCQSSQHRQSSCAVYRTAALPVLAGLADIERITSHSTNAIGTLCAAQVQEEWRA